MTCSPAKPEPSAVPVATSPSPLPRAQLPLSAAPSAASANPLLALPFEPSIEGLGPEFWDVVEAAPFPRTTLRFRNDDLLRRLGLDAAAVTDADF